MKKCGVVFLLAVGMFLSGSLLFSQITQKQGNERTIRELEARRRLAVLNNDTTTLNKMYAEGMTVIDSDGDLHTNTSHKESVELNRPANRKTLTWDTDQMDVTDFGEAV